MAIAVIGINIVARVEKSRKRRNGTSSTASTNPAVMQLATDIPIEAKTKIEVFFNQVKKTPLS